jgi:hypothetical protein
MTKAVSKGLTLRQPALNSPSQAAKHLAPDVSSAFRAFKPVAIQTALGYSSAALGLLCELIIAARFGATAQTDLCRWAGLLPFYATTLFGGLLLPVFLRSRLFPRSGTAIYVLRKNRSGIYGYAPTLIAAGVTLAILDLAAIVMGQLFPGEISLLFQSALLASTTILYAIVVAPLFFHGWIWVNTLVGTLSNLILLVVLLSPIRNFYAAVSFGMGIAALLLLSISWLPRSLIGNGAFEELAKTCEHVPPTPLRHVAKTAMSSLASIASTIIYFSALTLSGAGLVSIYITTQKAGLLLAVPANAIFNKFIRDDFMIGGRANVVAHALKSAFPIFVVSPLFAILSFSLLTVVYDLDPLSNNAQFIASGCAAGATLAALTSCMTLLTVGRLSSRHAALPAFISIGIALAGASLISILHGPTWSTAAPMFGGALASSLGLTWISWRTGHGLRTIWLFVIGSFLLAGAMMAMLPRPPLLHIAQWAYALRQIVNSHFGS